MKQHSIIILILYLIAQNFALAQPQLLWLTTNKDTLLNFEKFEISCDINANYANPFNESEISVKALIKSPTNKNYTVGGFYYQDYQRSGPPETLKVVGSPFWKVRFTPNETGLWKFILNIIDGTGSFTSPEYSFLVLPSDKKGFIRVANSRYLKYDNGMLFFPIGQNIPWYNLPNRTYDYENWINKLAENKANFLRVWMASKSFQIEWTGTPLGDYRNRLNRAYQLDWLLDYCEKNNFVILLVLYSHGMFSTEIDSEWSFNPYNIAQGGHLDFPFQFFSDTLASNFNKMKIKYIMNRWGYSTSLLGYELFNEIDHVDSFYTFQNRITNWLNETAAFIKQNDIYGHLVTNSYWDEFLDENIWNSPYIDFTQTHHYNETSDVQSIHYFYNQMKANDFYKPSFIGEFDFIKLGLWGRENDPDGVDLHNCLWSSAFSGAFGSSLSWSWDNYIDYKNLYRHYKGISTFISRTDLLNENFIPIIPFCSSSLKTNYSISPAFTKFAKAPQNLFLVSREGFISPSNIYLGKYLYGSISNLEKRNPPTFYLDFPTAGEFKVVCGNDSSKQPRINISVNGITRLDLPATINATYSVNVNQGNQQIKVDNTGNDWIKINEYVVTNYVSAIRSYALRGDSTVIGWVHNRNYNWKYLRDFGDKPDTIFDGQITIFGVKKNGYYQVDWYDCNENSYIKKDIVNTNNNNLTFNVPPILWDLSYKITYIGTTRLNDIVYNDKDFQLYQNYPNPFNSSTVVKFYVPKYSKIKLEILNILGQKVATIFDDFLSQGEHLSQIDTDKFGLSSGVYFYTLSTDKYKFVRKMLIVK